MLQVVELDPTLFKGRLFLAKSFLANEKYIEARKQILKAIELNSLDHNTYRILIQIDKNINKEIFPKLAEIIMMQI